MREKRRRGSTVQHIDKRTKTARCFPEKKGKKRCLGDRAWLTRGWRRASARRSTSTTLSFQMLYFIFLLFYHFREVNRTTEGKNTSIILYEDAHLFRSILSTWLNTLWQKWLGAKGSDELFRINRDTQALSTPFIPSTSSLLLPFLALSLTLPLTLSLALSSFPSWSL